MENRLYRRGSREIKIGSFFIAFLLMSGHMMQLFSFVLGAFPAYRLLLAAFAVFSIYKYGLKLRVRDLYIVIFILAFFLISRCFFSNDYINEYFFSFLIYGTIGLIFSYCKLNSVEVLTVIFRLGLLWFAGFILFNRLDFNIYGGMSIGHLLFPIIVALFLLISTEKQNRIIRLLFIVLFTALLVIYSSRGPVLCLVLFFVIWAFSKIKHTKHKIVYLVLLALVFVAITNVTEILLIIHNNTSQRIEFVEKSLFLLSNENDITNGRIGIITSAFDDFSLSNILTGIGIGTFQAEHAIVGYTHNLILSSLLEFGIIGVGYIIYMLVSSLRQVYYHGDVYFMYLFSIAILPLMFSGIHWTSFAFWLFIFTFNKLRKANGSIVQKAS